MIDTICMNCNRLIIPFFSGGEGASSSISCPYCKSRLFNNRRDFVQTVTTMVVSHYKKYGFCRPKNFTPITKTDGYIDVLLDCLELYCEMHCPSDFKSYISVSINRFIQNTDPLTKDTLIRASILIHENLMKQITRSDLPDYL